MHFGLHNMIYVCIDMSAFKLDDKLFKYINMYVVLFKIIKNCIAHILYTGCSHLSVEVLEF